MSGITQGIGDKLGITDKAKQKKAARSVIESNADVSETAKQLAFASHQLVGQMVFEKRKVDEPLTPRLTVLDSTSTELTYLLGHPIQILPVLDWTSELAIAEANAQRLSEDMVLVKLNLANAGTALEVAQSDLELARSPKGVASTVKSWFARMSGLVIFGLILSVILTGGASIPFIGRMVVGLVGMFPKLLGLIGIVGKGTVSGIVKSIDSHKRNLENGMLKDRIKEHAVDRSYTKAEVESILDGASSDLRESLRTDLNVHSTRADRRIVDQLKAAAIIEDRTAGRK